MRHGLANKAAQHAGKQKDRLPGGRSCVGGLPLPDTEGGNNAGSNEWTKLFILSSMVKDPDLLCHGYWLALLTQSSAPNRQ